MKKFLWVLSTMVLISGCAGGGHVQETATEDRLPEVPRSRGKEIAQVFVKEALQQYQFVKEPEITSLVNEIGKEIVAATGSDPAAYRFLIVKGDVPNAFAIPGGYIFIFDSLISKLRSPRELAGILAHEVAHVERNHHFKDESKITAATMATMAAIILSGGDPAVVMAGIAANVEMQLHYSRENESEADTYAIKYLRNGGYDPASLLESFRTLAFYEQFNAPDMPIYFSTHPGLDQRQIHLELMLRQEDHRRSYKAIPVDWDRIIVGLRARQYSVADVPLLVEGLKNVAENPEKRHYLLGVAFLRTGQFSKAAEEYRAAIALNPVEPNYHADLSLSYLQLKKTAEARSEAEAALGLREDHSLALTVLGRLEQHEGRYAESIGLLERARKSRDYDPLVYFHLARAYEKVGDEAQQAYYLGRFLRLDLKPTQAIQQFLRARRLAAKDSDLGQKIAKELVELQRDGL